MNGWDANDVVSNLKELSNLRALLMIIIIAIHKFLINFDYGILDKRRVGENVDYSVNGNYFRAGIDFNVLKKDPDGNAFFFGIKKFLA